MTTINKNLETDERLILRDLDQLPENPTQGNLKFGV